MHAQLTPAAAPPLHEPMMPTARTYPAAPAFAPALAPLPWPPPILPVPGPAALGPGGVQGGRGSAVPGVAMVPVTAVAPPALPGGPHPLPGLPPCPLPLGFPNPFAIRAAVVAPAQPASGTPAAGHSQPGASPAGQPAPGTVTITGPSGYMPGIGYFDPLQTAAAAAPWLAGAPGAAT